MKKTLCLFLLCAVILRAEADGTQGGGSGSPLWFSWVDFCAGAAASWVLVGPMFVYWAMKRSAGNALG